MKDVDVYRCVEACDNILALPLFLLRNQDINDCYTFTDVAFLCFQSKSL